MSSSYSRTASCCLFFLATGLANTVRPETATSAQETGIAESGDGDSDPKFQPRHVLPRQPAIVHPPMLSASQVTNQVTESDLVLGVVVNGEARAYPINMLNGPRREIINDTLGDQPIVAMWCHLCHSAIVFDRRVNDQLLTFQVSGMLWNRTLVMYDSETKSLWSLLLAKGMTGPMNGRKLKTLPSELTTWKKWKSVHPETSVLNMSHMQDRFVREFYDEPHPFVFGFIADRPYHITLETLRNARVLDLSLRDDNFVATLDEETFSIHLFNRKVDGQILSFEPENPNDKPPVLMTDTQTKSTWDAYSGTAIDGPLKGKQLEQEIGTIAYTQNWNAFYPRSMELPILEQNQR
ncbi:MAG: DUF3179 domain-containing (seleno)protein [Planctomycetota bacterium]|nr:DUF3179 domain-containing (seleno)protein [Planctomycetota bacterium]